MLQAWAVINPNGWKHLQLQYPHVIIHTAQISIVSCLYSQ